MNEACVLPATGGGTMTLVLIAALLAVAGAATWVLARRASVVGPLVVLFTVAVAVGLSAPAVAASGDGCPPASTSIASTTTPTVESTVDESTAPAPTTPSTVAPTTSVVATTTEPAATTSTTSTTTTTSTSTTSTTSTSTTIPPLPDGCVAVSGSVSYMSRGLPVQSIEVTDPASGALRLVEYAVIDVWANDRCAGDPVPGITFFFPGLGYANGNLASAVRDALYTGHCDCAAMWELTLPPYGSGMSYGFYLVP